MAAAVSAATPDQLWKSSIPTAAGRLQIAANGAVS
jgi:hypothetical protein